jgi:hypothetical protein
MSTPSTKQRNLILTAVAAFLAAPLLAAPERLVVPLSDPGKPATVEASLLQGSIHVVAGKAGEVVILAESEPDGEEHEGDGPVIAGKAKEKFGRDRDERDSRAGMRRIPNSGFELEAEEERNLVSIGTNSWQQAIELRIEVPAGSSLELSLVNGEGILVEGVGGELELHNTNGDIEVRNARGPVSANTVNGEIKISFAGPLPDSPMAFSTLNGDIDLELPRGARLDVRLRSDNGEIYSDFDVALSAKAPEVQTDRSKGKYRVSVAKELTGKIGGGGPEVYLKTFNGDIVLRSANGG